jgi:small subunit ribosomal protein S5
VKLNLRLREVNKMAKIDEEVKKTVEAQGALSEETALDKAANAETVSEKMIEKEIKKEAEDPSTKAEKEKKIVKMEEKDKEDKKKGRPRRGRRRNEKTREEIVAEWEPKTKLGREVKDGKVKSIDEILEADKKILEPQIIDCLLIVKTDLIAIGQAKGKFGGGKRRAWRQTQRKTKEGNVPTFSTMAVVGDENGHIGIGSGKSQETLPARDKGIRKAKLNVMKIGRSCASFDCACAELHTVPFKVTGKSGSVKVTLIPAPQGTGLAVANELKKILKLAGIKDVYSRTDGQQRTTFNLAKACINALKKTNVEGAQ